jgi:predicted HTH domain antitoxin
MSLEGYRITWYGKNMKALTLEVPEDVSDALCLPEQEIQSRLLLELGLSLYAQNLLSLGKGAKLAGISQHEFSKQLGARGIVRHYTREELAEDLAHAGLQ